MLKPILLAALSLMATYLYNKLHYKRFKQYAQLPQMPPTLMLGNLKTLDDLIKRGEPDRHPGRYLARLFVRCAVTGSNLWWRRFYVLRDARDSRPTLPNASGSAPRQPPDGLGE